MPKFVRGDMWSCFDDVDHFLFTSNGVVKDNGQLVMGAGIAKQVAKRFPEYPKIFGDLVKLWCGPDHEYGTIFTQFKVGLFQVKYHWKSDADIPLIAYSASMLQEYAEEHPTEKIALNYPAIGHGHLARETVEPLLTNLLDNITIWSY